MRKGTSPNYAQSSGCKSARSGLQNTIIIMHGNADSSLCMALGRSSPFLGVVSTGREYPQQSPRKRKIACFPTSARFYSCLSFLGAHYSNSVGCTGRTVRRRLTGKKVNPELVSLAEETDATVEEFFWEFVRIAKAISYDTWPLFYLTQDGAIREWSKTEADLEKFILLKVKSGLYGRALDGTFCVRAFDGTWWTLQSAYRLSTIFRPIQFDDFILGDPIRPQVHIFTLRFLSCTASKMHLPDRC